MISRKRTNLRLSPKFRRAAAYLTLTCSPLCAFADQALATDSVVETLDALEVTGTRPQQVDATTLKLQTRVIETPRSVTIIDSARIQEQNFQSAADLLFWVPGLNTNGDSYHFFARGYRMLPGDWKVDGFSGRIAGGSYAPNLFGVENVTVLKGPAGLLYGATSSPGGQISLTTKKPREQQLTTVETRVNSYQGLGSSLGEQQGLEFSIDSTGPVNKSKRTLYRFLGNLDFGAPLSSVTDRNQFYRLNLTQKIDAKGHYKITPLVEWSREERDTRGGSISPSSSRTTADGSTSYTLDDISTQDINLAAGGRIDTNRTTGFDFEAAPSDAWKTNLSLRYQDRLYTNNAWSVQTGTLTKAVATDPYSWTVKRRHSRARTEYANTSLDLNTSYEWLRSVEFRSLLQAGVNGQRALTYSFTGTSGADQSAINIYSGLATTPLVADAKTDLVSSGYTRADTYNFYLQSQTTWNDCLTFNISGAFAGDHPTTKTTSVWRSSTVKPNASLVYMVTPKLSVYTSFSTSYSLPTATYQDAAGSTGAFDPISGENIELGSKAELIKGLLAASVSVFEMELNNTLVQSASNELNPNGVQYYTQLDGGRKSKGLELEFSATPAKGWTNTLSYAYLDAFDRNTDGSRAGAAPMTPRHAFSNFSRYSFSSGTLSGLGLSLGYIWQDKRIGGASAPTASAPDPLWLRAFSRIDAGLSYRLKSWSFGLNVENVLNKRYAVTGTTGLNLGLGNPRGYSFRAAYSW